MTKLKENVLHVSITEHGMYQVVDTYGNPVSTELPYQEARLACAAAQLDLVGVDSSHVVWLSLEDMHYELREAQTYTPVRMDSLLIGTVADIRSMQV